MSTSITVGFQRLFTAVMLSAAVLAFGCGGGSGTMCTYDGKSYRPGETFPSTDGCNTCSCDGSGSVLCTARACAPLSCLYEGKTYMPGESFPSVDGCNTCTCGSDGAIGCTKIGCPGPGPTPTEWLSLLPVQCNTNPWQTVSSTGDGMAPTYPDLELLSVDNFFEDHGIDLVEIGFLYPAKPEGVCTACSCPRGDHLMVRAKTADVATLEKTYGFKRLGSSDGKDGGLGYTPRQCGSNPWTSVAKPMTRDEAAAVANWTESKGASLARVGFVLRTSLVVVCDACSCPRGDRLVASAVDAGDAAQLRALSFSELPH